MGGDGMEHPVGSHIIMCPRCEQEIETTVWRDGPKMWFQCYRCGFYDNVTEDDFLEDDTE
jgi:Zn ribbon nucleic-acid-binding protein